MATSVKETAPGTPRDFLGFWWSWVLGLNRRLALFAAYIGFQLTISFSIGVWFNDARAVLPPFWTFWQGESSYIWWRDIFHLHPLTGYLPILLVAGTVHPTALWFIVFRGDGPLLDLPFFRWLFNGGRHQGFRVLLEKKRNRPTLYQLGLTPEVWPVAFLYLRQHPMRYGVATVLLGNATKLTLWSVLMTIGLGKEWLWVTVAAVILFSFLLPRLLERFLPRNSNKHSVRSLR